MWTWFQVREQSRGLQFVGFVVCVRGVDMIHVSNRSPTLIQGNHVSFNQCRRRISSALRESSTPALDIRPGMLAICTMKRRLQQAIHDKSKLELEISSFRLRRSVKQILISVLACRCFLSFVRVLALVTHGATPGVCQKNWLHDLHVCLK